jgi:hypothetical protein
VCGVLVENASHCPRHYRRRITPGRTTKQQAAFRQAVLLAAGGCCQAVENGVRCDVTSGLQAHHLERLADSRSYDPRKGVALCPHHHWMAERVSTNGQHAAA